ncbi:hypothetical protein FA15DRAFT_759942 [Coprinopsis marcescibilis]|uniref:F-box domain-containing protein n=1 Tax=Coprinopsis marcescibilis TaxID=230819 RepID=A0A5C3KID2_COPMA|nr:hypothetical protein FA15DRAFT_759942 [Coprinopsis marcescibilis]
MPPNQTLGPPKGILLYPSNHAVLADHRQSSILEAAHGAPYSGVCPIDRLPPELLYEVFLVACDGEVIQMDYEEDFNHISPLEPRPTCIELARVCSSWREAALSHPIIWTNIELMFSWELMDDRISDHLEAFARALDTVIKRSANLPLHIRISGDFHTLYNGFDLKIICDILLQHFHRWFTFAIEDIRIPYEIYRFMSEANADSHLTKISIVECDCFNSDEDLPTNKLAAPNLTHCTLNNIDEMMTFPIPWNQLKTLCIYNDRTGPWVENYHHIFVILRQSSALETLRIGIQDGVLYDADGYDPANQPTIHLLSLRVLELLNCSHFVRTALQVDISAPEVQQVDAVVSREGLREIQIVPLVNRFLRKPKLRQLRICLCSPEYLISSRGFRFRSPSFLGYLQSDNLATWRGWFAAIFSPAPRAEQKKKLLRTFQSIKVPDAYWKHFTRDNTIEDIIGKLLDNPTPAELSPLSMASIADFVTDEELWFLAEVINCLARSASLQDSIPVFTVVLALSHL